MTSSSSAEPRRASSYHAPALLLYIALTALLAWPLVAGLFEPRVPGWEGDNLYYVRSMWWWKRALFDLGISPFLDPTSYFPVGHRLAYSEMTPTNTLLFVPVTLVAGPVFAYNFVLIFSFVITGFGTYLWVTHLTGRRAAGLLAGTIVAFLPFRFAHLPGHLPQMTTQWIPLTLYAFERFLEKRTLARGAWLGAGAAFVVVGCWYYGYSLVLLMPLYAIARTWTDRAVWRDAAWWRGLGAAAAVGAAIVLPFLVEMLQLSGRGELHRSIAEMDSWSLNPYDLFIPNLMHPAWTETVSEWFPRQRLQWVERIHSLGYVATALAAVGLAAWRRRRALLAAVLVTWVVSFSIALGPTLHWGDRQVRVPVPARVADAVAGLVTDAPAVRQSFIVDGLPVPLPSYFLYELMPFTKGMRVMARFSIWTALMTAALAGFGLLTLAAAAERRFGRRSVHALVLACIALVAFESRGHVPTMAVGPRAVDVWLASQPDDTVIVELPVEQGTRGFQNYWATVHQRKTLWGWSGDSFAPPVLRERMAALGEFPSEASVEFLKGTAATHVLLTPAEIKEWDRMEPRLNASPALRFDRELGGVRVYQVVR